MKLISLNVWGGKIYDPLINFIKNYSDKADIFCLQDVLFGHEAVFTEKDGGRINIYEEIKNILLDFNSVKHRTDNESHFHSEALDPSIGCGQTIFIRKPLEFKETGGFKTGDSNLWNGGNMVSGKHQWAKFRSNDIEYVIMNVHGMWQAESSKMDTPERITQSKNINEFFSPMDSKKILCGDLNLIPSGKAMEILGHNMFNLIKKYDIKSTRSSHYAKSEKFADYILVSPDVKVKDFKVLDDEVSDHLPLYLDFE